MNPIDTSSLSVSAQMALSNLSLVSSEMGSLLPGQQAVTSGADLGASLFTGGAYLELSPAAQALVGGGSSTSASSGPAWESGYENLDLNALISGG